MSRAIPVLVHVIHSSREDGNPRDDVCGIFLDFLEAQSTCKRLGLWYGISTRWAIIEDQTERAKVYLLSGSGAERPTPMLAGVVFSEEKERVRREALSKLTSEEIEALGVKA